MPDQQETAPTRLYDLMEQRGIPAGLPDKATLDEVASAVHGAWEHLVEPVLTQLLATVNSGEANSVTYEDIGRLVLWSDNVADLGRDISEAAEKVGIVARESYEIAGGSSSLGSVLPLDKHGLVTDRDKYRQLRRDLSYAERGDA